MKAAFTIISALISMIACAICLGYQMWIQAAIFFIIMIVFIGNYIAFGK